MFGKSNNFLSIFSFAVIHYLFFNVRLSKNFLLTEENTDSAKLIAAMSQAGKCIHIIDFHPEILKNTAKSSVYRNFYRAHGYIER